MGGRASSDVIRHGAERSVVACVFEATPGAEAVLEENGIDPQGAEVILRREILASGKGRVFVNNQPATVAVLRALAPELALVHAQSETSASFDEAQQRGLVDRFGGVATDACQAAYRRWREIETKRRELEQEEQERLRALDLWQFQHKEIATIAPLAGEDEKLLAERRVLANSEKLLGASRTAYELLYEGSGSAEGTLTAALKQVEELARFDAKFTGAVQQLVEAKAAVEDVGATVRDYAETVQASPERLEEIEDRLASLDRLKRKYGASLEEVIAYGDQVAGKIAEIENRDAILEELRKQSSVAEAAYRAAASALTDARRTSAARLAKSAESQVNDLAMKVRFAIEVSSEEAPSGWTAHGWDTVRSVISTNPGEPLKPLDEVASGGEMSRVLLGLKVSVEEGFAAKPGAKGKKAVMVPRTLVFDEIDIGIGGRAAEAVGQKLKALSRSQQVLCVTHLPQIAAFADQHFLIEKGEKGGRTTTSVKLLTPAERTEEVARMLSGATLTDTSLRHAEQLLKASK